MVLLRVLFCVWIIGIALVPTNAGDESSYILRTPGVWLQVGLKWDRPEGAANLQEEYAAGTVLYFAKGGKFGVFRGVLVRTGRRLGLSEGDGEAVYAGDWKAAVGGAEVRYRLVSWYKLTTPAGQAPPVVPGPTQQSTVGVAVSYAGKKRIWHVEFDGKEYESTEGFRISELREHLRIHEEHPLGPNQ